MLIFSFRVLNESTALNLSYYVLASLLPPKPDKPILKEIGAAYKYAEGSGNKKEASEGEDASFCDWKCNCPNSYP